MVGGQGTWRSLGRRRLLSRQIIPAYYDYPDLVSPDTALRLAVDISPLAPTPGGIYGLAFARGLHSLA